MLTAFISRSKNSEKTGKFKAVNLVSVASCILEVPKKIPLAVSRAKLEGMCVRIVLNTEYVPRDGAQTKGQNIDLRFSSADVAKNFVETANTLKARAIAVRKR